ncbi:hypothetical protein [Neobacillus mesonae]|uniref:hypothetical protein n=1 Tax=Neobacillus mesonae TaxID=1193713 RepID=UPI002573F7D6|nr:hypothetical protein [Neobacillus mesonae]
MCRNNYLEKIQKNGVLIVKGKQRVKQSLIKSVVMAIVLSIFIATVGTEKTKAFYGCKKTDSVVAYGIIPLDPREGGDCTDTGSGGTVTKPGAGTGTGAETDSEYMQVVEIIEDTDTKTVYTARENGKLYLYEESTNGDNDDNILTMKYSLEGSNKSLVEKYNTEMKTTTTTEGQIITVTTKDLLKNTSSVEKVNTTQIISDSTAFYQTMTSPTYEYSTMKEISSGTTTTPDATTDATKGKWVKSLAGSRMGYYLYSNGGGLARWSTMEKKLSSWNSNFDTFTRNVDAMKGLETASLWTAVGLGGLELALSIKPPYTLAKLKKFFKKSLGRVPGIGILVSIGWWLYYYDKAANAWNKIPVGYYRW